ncbi:MAG: restriction endonuclease subunit S [Gammaproteobacteria bacterium]|nr:restriction endonuclease subunit S [Gammaproteobacteria bacterium]
MSGSKGQGGESRRAWKVRRADDCKDSADSSLGAIPKNWHALPIKRVCRLCYGDSLAATDRGDGDVDVFGSNGPIGKHDRANTQGPSLIVGRKGSFGKVTYTESDAFAIDTTFFTDSRYTKGNIRWLYYALQNARLDAASKDSAIPGLDREDAYARRIAVGSMSEQRKIADFLDRETMKIDALVASKGRMIELLQEKRAALITRTIVRGLDTSVPKEDSGVPWLGKVPAHWDIAPVYARYEVELGKMLDSKNLTGLSSGKYLRNVDVQWDKINVQELAEMDFTPSDRKRYRLSPGDLLVCEGGEVGRSAIWAGELEECFYQKAIHRVRPRTASELPRYFYFVMRALATSGVFSAGGNPNTIDHLTAVRLRHYRFPFPPLNEQRGISELLDRETAKVDRLVAQVEEAIDRLMEFRAALIYAAVTGKINIREEAS